MALCCACVMNKAGRRCLSTKYRKLSTWKEGEKGAWRTLGKPCQGFEPLKTGKFCWNWRSWYSSVSAQSSGSEQWESAQLLCAWHIQPGWKSHHMTLGIMLNPLQHSPLPCSSHTSFKTSGLWLAAGGSLQAVSGGIILKFKWQFTGIFSFFWNAVLHSTLSISEINNWSKEF